MARPLKILACMFQGGGNIPLILPILAELVARNHRVRVMVGPGVRQSRLTVSPSLLQRVGEMGAELVRFNEPDVHPFDDPISADRALIGSWTPASFRSVQREARTPVWAPAWALNVSDELRREKADLVWRPGGVTTMVRFQPRQFDPTSFVVVDNLPANTVVAIRRR